jgi:hypothetical protein
LILGSRFSLKELAQVFAWIFRTINAVIQPFFLGAPSYGAVLARREQPASCQAAIAVADIFKFEI